MSVITFPDTVAVVITRLRAALPGLTFAHDVPNPRPSTFIRVLRTGGPRANLVVDGAQLTIESWAPDADTAAANATVVRAQLNHLPEVPVSPNPIYLVEEMSGPQELPDPVSASRRFTWTAVVHIRAS